MDSVEFEHTNDALPGRRDDPAATDEPTSFHLGDDSEVLYVPGDPEY